MSTAHGSVRKHGLPTATQQREYGYVAHVCHTPTQGLADKLAAREASDATHPATFGVGSPPVLLPDHPASRRVTMRVNVSGSAALGDQTHTDGGLECSIRQSMLSRALPSSSIWQTFLSLPLMLGRVCCFGGRCLFGSSTSSDTSMSSDTSINLILLVVPLYAQGSPLCVLLVAAVRTRTGDGPEP